MAATVRTIDLTLARPPDGEAVDRLSYEGVIEHDGDAICLRMDWGGRICFPRRVWAIWDCAPPVGARMRLTFAAWGGRGCVDRVETVHPSFTM